jgi:HK97 family phage portal protein
MPTLIQSVASWFSRWGSMGGALTNRRGQQFNTPSAALLTGVSSISPDAALQIATIWACIERRANIVASLPLFAYDVPKKGPKEKAYRSRLWQVLHDSPNPRMTPFEFWRAMMINYDLRGNAYARIVREPGKASDPNREAVALWPLAADQVEQWIDPTGAVWYLHRLEDKVYVYPAEDILHLKNLGNGTSGFAKLEFMAAAVHEASSQMSAAAKTFGNGGKPTAILMTDKVLRQDQRIALQDRFVEMGSGSEARLFVLEADMKYQQLSASPEQLQLLESRKFSVEELCRWFDVPPVLVYHSSQTAWGSGIEQILEGFHKFTISPLCVGFEQGVRKTVLTPAQRSKMSVEFNLDALLRGSPTARFTLYATATQNGVMTRDECRALENLPLMGGGADLLTAQANLLPLEMLGQQPAGGENPGTQPAIGQ